MAAQPGVTTGEPGVGAGGAGVGGGPDRRLATETKASFKTSEFYVYLVILLALLIAGSVVNVEDGPGGDPLRADEVWLYAVILTVGYMVSRGIAKAGSRDPYWEQPGGAGSPLTERLRGAASALTEGPESPRAR